MALYEYECAKCGVMELSHPMSDPALTTCPKCQGKSFQRLISKSSFTLKGGGWYAQGYAATGPAKKDT